jgi:uncharacterized membrane protein YhaH (DUF805 family)
LQPLKKETNPARDYFKLLLFVLFLIELVLFFAAIIFGRLLDYDLAFIVCFWFGIIVAGCYALIVLSNVLVIACIKLFRIIMRKKRAGPDF